MIYEFLGSKPVIHPDTFIAESADIIGDVTVGKQSSIWFNVTIRGDVNYIRIGERTSIQDNTCIHVTHETAPTIIGSDVTIGHSAMIHGCTIHDRVLVGIQAVILDGAVIESDVFIAAGTLVPPGKVLKSGYMYMGSPAKATRKLTEAEIVSLKEHAGNYVRYSRAYTGADTYDENPFYKKPD